MPIYKGHAYEIFSLYKLKGGERGGWEGQILAVRIQKLQKAHGFIVLRLPSIR
jgi:hypothetical protein